MARIRTLSEDHANEAQRALIEQTKKEYGVFTGIRQVLLADPNVAMPVKQLVQYLSLRKDSPFTRLQLELIGTLVYGLISQQACSCLGIHSEAVRRLTQNPSFGPDFAFTWRNYGTDPKTQALLAFAEKLTTTPGQMEDADIEALRAAGWDEQAIYEVTALIGLYNCTGRMEAAAGLPPDRFPPDAQFPEAMPDGH